MNYPIFNSNVPYGTYQPQGTSMYQQPQSAVGTQANAIRTVYSEAEARNAQIPTDGSTTYFADVQNGKIYEKKFDFSNGSFPFVVYERKEVAQQTRYATLDDLNALREELTAVKKGRKVADE